MHKHLEESSHLSGSTCGATWRNWFSSHPSFSPRVRASNQSGTKSSGCCWLLWCRVVTTSATIHSLFVPVIGNTVRTGWSVHLGHRVSGDSHCWPQMHDSIGCGSLTSSTWCHLHNPTGSNFSCSFQNCIQPSLHEGYPTSAKQDVGWVEKGALKILSVFLQTL